MSTGSASGSAGEGTRSRGARRRPAPACRRPRIPARRPGAPHGRCASPGRRCRSANSAMYWAVTLPSTVGLMARISSSMPPAASRVCRGRDQCRSGRSRPTATADRRARSRARGSPWPARWRRPPTAAPPRTAAPGRAWGWRTGRTERCSLRVRQRPQCPMRSMASAITRGQVTTAVAIAFQQVKGHALRRLGPDAGQAAQGVDRAG